MGLQRVNSLEQLSLSHWWLNSKESPCSAGDTRDIGSIHRWGRSPREGNVNPLQYSHLEKFMDRGAWKVIVHGVTKSQTQLSTHTHTHMQKQIKILFK